MQLPCAALAGLDLLFWPFRRSKAFHSRLFASAAAARCWGRVHMGKIVRVQMLEKRVAAVGLCPWQERLATACMGLRIDVATSSLRPILDITHI